jgi:hypothetical protein
MYNSVPINPSCLVGVTTHVMYMLLAYHKFKAELDRLKKISLAPRVESFCKDLVFLFKFAVTVWLCNNIYD